MFNLMPWKKKREADIKGFNKEVDSLFDRFLGSGYFPTKEFLGEGLLFPKIDISEGKKDITIKAEIPGVEAKDIDVSLDGRLLNIKGEKKQEKEEKDDKYHRVERSYGYFNRTIELPAEVDDKSVDASYKKGILTVVLKKAKESESTKIVVKTE